ncbi:MAG: 23S rRNA (guanosine(2251)-2'-O)-methyltransferase RlmB [Hyphomicrobiales bacterium]
MSRRSGGKYGPSSDARGREPGSGHRPQKRSGQKHPYLYGLHTVGEALANPKRRHRALLITENALRRLEERMPVLPIAPQIVKPDEIDRLVGMDAVHQGVALDTESVPAPHLRDLPAKGILLVLDQVTDPHNVGAIMRSAAAFGAEGLIVTERHSAEANGVLAKAASGGLEYCPLIEVVNLAQTLTELGDMGYWRVGLDSGGLAIVADSLATAPIALVLGAEGKGLRRLTRERCDVLARLDMPGPIKSLNVSNAAAVALFTVHNVLRTKG